MKNMYFDDKNTIIKNALIIVIIILILLLLILSCDRKYTVKFIDDGSIYDKVKVSKNEIIQKPQDPVKEGYKFKYWSLNKKEYKFNEKINKSIKLYAVYEEDGAIKNYKVVFRNYDGKILQTSYMSYENIPTYDGNTPIKEPTEEYTYVFKNWNEEINEETNEISYTAVYESIKNKYKIIFKDSNGDILQEETIEYGIKPTYKGVTPTKAPTEKYTYIFNGWDKEIKEVTKEEVYTAVYINNPRKYTITYIDNNVTKQSQKYDYGNVVYSEINVAKEGYTFDGWYKTDGTKQTFPITVTEDLILYSRYTINKYRVSFYHNGEKYVQDKIVNYNQTVQKPNENPIKTNYNFVGWTIKGTNKLYNFNNPVKQNIELESSFERKTTCTVSYVIENEEIEKVETIIGQPVNKIENPTKKGYLFDKWYKTNDYIEEFDFNIAITEDTIIYGKYNENSHKVTFMNDEITYQEQKVLDSYSAVKPVNPTKAGYTFKYWSLNNSEYNFDNEVTDDITLEATYEINKYNIVFKNYDGTVLESKQVEYDNTPEYTLSTPTKPSNAEYTYEFSGWSPSIEKVKQDKEYIAQYTNTKNKYTISFIDQGETLETLEYEYGSVIINPTIPSKEGYTFVGWYKDDGEIPYNLLLPVVTDVVLYSRYEINRYKITFKNYDGEILEEKYVEHNKVPVYTGQTPTKNKIEEYTYIFDGWNEEITQATDNKEYIAKYKEQKNKYTLTYIDDDTNIEQIEYEYGSVVLIPKEVSKIGYTFKGWYKENDEKQIYPLTITSDVILTSKYEINKYRVSFYHNDEKYIEDQIVDYGSLVTKPIDPEKQDYNFSGWVYKNTTNKYNFSTPVTNNIELESSFTNKLVYKVSFVVEGEKIDEIEVIEGNKINRIENPKKKGYLFDKWYQTNSYIEEFDFNTIITQDTTLYGRYLENAHTVTYMNGLEKYNEETVLDSNKATRPTDPIKEGYTFKYWELGNLEYDFNIEVKNDITLQAVFEINKYNVVFKNEDLTLLQSEELEYGEIPIYKGEIPNKQATDEYTYTFNGWDKVISAVTEDIIYIAQYTNAKNKYTITFTNSNSEVLQIENLEYGETPVYKGEIPTKEATSQYTYSFDRWNKDISIVTQNETYVATYTQTINKYIITFKNEDGTILQTEELEYGEIPVYKGETPKKETIAQYTYTFKGWSPQITEVTSQRDYIAQYTKTDRKYTINFVNEDGTILQTENLNYWDMPSYKGEVPTKEATAQYTYTFKGWNKTITRVTGNKTYTATYNNIINKYTVTFVDEDETVLQTEELEYGETPVYKGETPTKQSNAQYTYVFNGWSPEITTVSANTTYKAVYDQIINKYTITFKNENGIVLQTEQVDYGELPVYSASEPTKESSQQYTYTFNGWSPEIALVTEDKEYTATYIPVTRNYLVTFKNEDGTVLQSSNVQYGELPVYSSNTPSKAQTAQYTYTFSGWSPDVTIVTGEKIYTAQYTPVLRSYTITFENEDGTVLQSSSVNYGATPAYNGATPTKAQTAQYTYTFSGWSPTITTVTGAKIYTATYTSQSRGGPTKDLPKNGETWLATVYLDPTDLTKTCTKELSEANVGDEGILNGLVKSGCMKWYAYKSDGTNYKLILDHNTTSIVSWYSGGYTESGPTTALAQLQTDTTGWQVTADLITADEIKTITGNTTFNVSTAAYATPAFYFDSNNTNQTANGSSKSRYAWLFDNLYACSNYGCNKEASVNSSLTSQYNNTQGYWTKTGVANDYRSAWLVHLSGSLFANSNGSTAFGIRPVITVAQSAIR